MKKEKLEALDKEYSKTYFELQENKKLFEQFIKDLPSVTFPEDLDVSIIVSPSVKYDQEVNILINGLNKKDKMVTVHIKDQRVKQMEGNIGTNPELMGLCVDIVQGLKDNAPAFLDKLETFNTYAIKHIDAKRELDAEESKQKNSSKSPKP